MLKKIVMVSAGIMLLAGCASTKKIISDVETSSTTQPTGISIVAETPFEQVLNEDSALKTELNSVEIRQIFNQVEAPNVAQITVLKTGLLDDAILAERTTYSFKLLDEQWKLIDKKQEYKCVRGQNTKTFQTNLCP